MLQLSGRAPRVPRRRLTGLKGWEITDRVLDGPGPSMTTLREAVLEPELVTNGHNEKTVAKLRDAVFARPDQPRRRCVA
jgi:hypothetical protein